MLCPRVGASGIRSKANRTGRVVPAVTVSVMSLVPGVCVPIRNTVERPRWVSVNLRCAARLRRARAGTSTRRRIFPGARMLRLFPVTKSSASTVRTEPSGAHSSYRASSATVSVIMGPAGSDMQMFPPTVAAFQILKEERNASQDVARSEPAVQSAGGTKAWRSRIVHVAPISRPASARTRGSHGSTVRSTRRRSSGCSTENSHVPPASQASPSRQSAPGRSDGRRTTSVMVLRSMGTHLPLHAGLRHLSRRARLPAAAVTGLETGPVDAGIPLQRTQNAPPPRDRNGRPRRLALVTSPAKGPVNSGSATTYLNDQAPRVYRADAVRDCDLVSTEYEGPGTRRRMGLATRTGCRSTSLRIRGNRPFGADIRNARGNSHLSPLSRYSAPGGLPQGPSRGAESLA